MSKIYLKYTKDNFKFLKKCLLSTFSTPLPNVSGPDNPENNQEFKDLEKNLERISYYMCYVGYPYQWWKHAAEDSIFLLYCYYITGYKREYNYIVTWKGLEYQTIHFIEELSKRNGPEKSLCNDLMDFIKTIRTEDPEITLYMKYMAAERTSEDWRGPR